LPNAGYEALGVPRPGARTAQRQSFVAQLDAVIAGRAAQTARDEADLEAAVTAAEAAWAQDAHRSAERAAPARTASRPKSSRCSGAGGRDGASDLRTHRLASPTRCAAPWPGR
jgi:hypothetical protein